jgi:hypothetical protein
VKKLAISSFELIKSNQEDNLGEFFNIHFFGFA